MKKAYKCALCENAKIHAEAHGNDPTYVVCKIHRITNWYAENAYNLKNVAWRNPINANKYTAFEETEDYEIPWERIDENVIAKNDYIQKDNYVLCGVVVADIEKGEYENRHFAILAIDKEKDEYIIVPDFDGDFNAYLGFATLSGCVETCTYGHASEHLILNPMKRIEQRTSCDECKEQDVLLDETI